MQIIDNIGGKMPNQRNTESIIKTTIYKHRKLIKVLLSSNLKGRETSIFRQRRKRERRNGKNHRGSTHTHEKIIKKRLSSLSFGKW